MDQIKCEILDDEDLDAEANVGGARIGYLWCTLEGDRLKISDLHVDDAYRRQGIGTRLLRQVLDAADDLASVRCGGWRRRTTWVVGLD